MTLGNGLPGPEILGNGLIKGADSPLMGKAEAAMYLNTTERHVQELWNRREIPAIKVGRKVRFAKADLDHYIERRRTF